MLLTDPPYNVDYTGGTDEHLKIANDNMEDAAFRQFLTDAFKAADAVMHPGAAFYIWHADSEGFNFRGACRNVGWPVKQCLIWNKNALVLGRQDYQWKHEPCLYGWKEGSHYFVDDRSLVTVLKMQQPDPKQMKKDELVALVEEILGSDVPTTILDEKKPAKSDIHPTMKPVKLFSRLILNSSRRNQNVLDIFGGSGTTMIACEETGRNAFLMELDPRYCDAILERWETMTGSSAQLISG